MSASRCRRVWLLQRFADRVGWAWLVLAALACQVLAWPNLAWHASAHASESPAGTCGADAARTSPAMGGPEGAAVPSFLEEVVPVLTRYGCNSGGCHGKLAGQNGFRLSLRGYAPEMDYDSLVRESRGRRVMFAAPLDSLLLQKATGMVPHGGGARIQPGSPAHRLLADWLAAGAPGPRSDESRVQELIVEPSAVTLRAGDSRPLRVTARYDDGRQADVTWLCQFASGQPDLLRVTEDGLVTCLRNGESAVRVAFQGFVQTAVFTAPHERSIDERWYARANNEIDRHVYAKLQQLRIRPAPLCDDATFLRRASLDALGTLPTETEVAEFLADPSPDKRSVLVERLLARPEWVDYWTLQLADLLQNRRERDHDVRGSKGVRGLHQWLHARLQAGDGWREIAEGVLLAEGTSDVHPEVGYYIVTVGEQPAERSEVTDSVAQAFLGTRIGCARCHNHPLEKYTQDDYYHLAAFFSRTSLDRRPTAEGPTELVAGSGEMLQLRKQQQQLQHELEMLGTDEAAVKSRGEKQQQLEALRQRWELSRQQPAMAQQPRTGRMLHPRPIDRVELTLDVGQDPRRALLGWMTGPGNRLFAGAMVNRVWKHFLGVGMVEPVDDLRATNPPSNPPLWELLVREFTASDYDLRYLMRLIMNSRTYQHASDTDPANVLDDRYYSRFYARRLPAEVLLDAISQVTGAPESFPGQPLGVRAIQVPDPGADSYFLTLFGRSARTTACACERAAEVTLPQLLHLQNSSSILAKIQSPTGILATALAAEAENEPVVTRLFLATVSRRPTEAELQSIDAQLRGQDREEVLADLLWALLNSKEFTFNH